MTNKNEIESVLREEVAKCKAIPLEEIDTNAALVEVIGLLGDDFMAIADYVHRKYRAYPPKGAYCPRMTISEWASIISDAATH